MTETPSETAHRHLKLEALESIAIHYCLVLFASVMPCLGLHQPMISPPELLQHMEAAPINTA